MFRKHLTEEAAQVLLRFRDSTRIDHENGGRVGLDQFIEEQKIENPFWNSPLLEKFTDRDPNPHHGGNGIRPGEEGRAGAFGVGSIGLAARHVVAEVFVCNII